LSFSWLQRFRYGGLLFGFGRRIEREALGIDVSLFSYGAAYTHASVYLGGGAGWGLMSLWRTIRAGIGARVAVTDQTGQTTKGTITQLSASSLELGGSAGVARVFDETSLRTIRLLYSPKHEALPGLLAGAVTGALMGSLLVAAFGGDASEVVGGAAAMAGILGGTWAATDLTIGAFRYPFNDAYDVYRSAGRGAFRSAITMAPQVTQARKRMLVSVGF
jgi:hypothetical protein